MTSARGKLKTTRPAPAIDIIAACRDPNIFGRWFAHEADRRNWFVVLKTIFGLPLDDGELATFREHTGRSAPAVAGYNLATLVIGRRGGKSVILATCAAFLSAFYDWRPFLTGGEAATILVVSADKKSGQVTFRYLKEMLSIPLLAGLIQRETAEVLELSNGVNIEVTPASYRTIRGRTLAGCLADEQAFWRTDDGANPDVEVMAAIRPAMLTIPNAKLIKASSPYARKGVLWDDYRRHYGNDDSPTLVWQASTQVMHPSIDQAFLDAEYADDPARARAEYGATFRTDVETFIAREAVEACVCGDRFEVPPMLTAAYTAFVDPSGGSSDAMTVAIGHREGELAALDVLREFRPPFSPEEVVTEICELLARYRVHTVLGDRYAGMWPRERFAQHGVVYEAAAKPKSDLYRDLLPILNGGRCELLDHPRAIAQICSLERRTARGGKDSIDHPPKMHDDLANAIAGCLTNLIASSEMWSETVSWNEGIFGVNDVIENEEQNYREAAEAYAAGELRPRDVIWFLAERDRRSKRGGLRG
jgi:hypothetical protein